MGHLPLCRLKIPVVCFAVALFGAIVSMASAATFPGTGTGALPDGLAGTPPMYGAPLVVSFAVSGLTSEIAAVGVSFTLSHSWVGDVDVVLASEFESSLLALVSRIGVTAAGAYGDSSNYAGTYYFADDATSTDMANIWSVALGTNGNPPCDTTCTIVNDTYRTTGVGAPGQTNPPPFTSLNATFGLMLPIQSNGIWTLTFRDGAAGDTGSVTGANLYIFEARIFADGFNTGNTLEWSLTVP